MEVGVGLGIGLDVPLLISLVLLLFLSLRKRESTEKAPIQPEYPVVYKHTGFVSETPQDHEFRNELQTYEAPELAQELPANHQ